MTGSHRSPGSHSGGGHSAGGKPTEQALGGFLKALDSRLLLALVALVFVVDAATPDLLPLVDEIVLGCATLLLARWQHRRRHPPADIYTRQTKNVTETP